MKTPSSPQLRDASGVSLVAVLVGLGLAGILAYVVTTITSRGILAQKHVELRGDLEDIRNAMRLQASCSATLPVDMSTCPCADNPGATPPYTCGANAYFAVRSLDSANNPVDMIPRNATQPSLGSRYGKWWLRASCTPTQMVVEVARHDGAGNFETNGFNNAQQSWTPLFRTPFCSTSGANGSGLLTRLVTCNLSHVSGNTYSCSAACGAGETVTGGGYSLGAAYYEGSTALPDIGNNRYRCSAAITSCSGGLSRPCNSRCYAVCTKAAQ